MRTNKLHYLSLLALFLLLASVPGTASQLDGDLSPTEIRVQKALKKLPYYGVFDYIAFDVDQDMVTLKGKVHRALLKSEAESAVLRLEEISGVENQIEILPVSQNDDRIRLAAVRAIYSNPMLSRYGAGVHPKIRVIVERGTITLEGVVRAKSHSHVAEVEARSVSGAFQVRNNLRWEKS